MAKKQYRMDDVEEAMEALQEVVDGCILALDRTVKELKENSSTLADLRMQSKNWRHIGRTVNGLTIPEDESE